MNQIKTTIESLNGSGLDVYWMGAASNQTIDAVEASLGCKFPTSFRSFLGLCGGGGVVEEEISGIKENDPTHTKRGTILGDTKRCQEEFELPVNLIVIYAGFDSVVWCLDPKADESECPVVSFNVYTKEVRPLRANFTEFFEEYASLRCARTD